MPIVKKTKHQVIHLDETDPQFMDKAADGPAADARLNLDPRIKAQHIEILPIDQIRPNPRNARKHSERQISVLAANIDKFGYWIPALVDDDNVLQAGHARLMAAQRVGLRHLPVIRQSELTPAARRAWAIADNKISELGDWDYDILGEEFTFLDPLEGVDLDLLQLTGFETAEIDQIIDPAKAKADPADEVVTPDKTAPPVTRPGDVWICNDHSLMCGDAREPAHYTLLMGEERAQIVFTDPPYNVPNAGHVTKRDGVREFEMACGEMTEDQFTGFLHVVANNLRSCMADGAVAYLCIDWRHMRELRAAADPIFGPIKNLIAWVKPNAGMGSFYRSQHELIFLYRLPGKTVNNFGLGGKGRHRSNVWTYAGMTSFGRHRDEELAMHPTVKPVAMVKDALKDCSDRGDIVVDPFGGSGTTMIAAEATRRRARLMEIDPHYCDIIVERWQRVTGKTAHLSGTNESFADAKRSRATAP